MRIVRWSPQERVDIPDMAAASSFLVLGEFRRTLRGVIMGEQGNRLINGFKVVPAAVPNSTVIVKLDPGGGSPLGFAIGAERIGSRVDYGQLVGGDNSDAQLEGNAQQILDFSAKPADTYTVQMRFLYTEGVNDNRAFWNNTAGSEFTSAVDTRHLPVYELRAPNGVPPSDEWISLATIVWPGAGTITAGMIVDARTFAMEDNAPYDVATQSTAGAYPDFDRTATRGDNGVNGIYPALRALGRQVMDLKGQDNTGNFNWYARPFKAADGAASLFATAQTKSLRTVDTMTYTVGDGTTTFGDFNGATGFESCLAHIDALDAANQAPQKVTIYLRTNNPAGFTWNQTAAHIFSNTTHLEIIGIDAAGPFNAGGRASINMSAVPATAFGIVVTGSASGNSSLTVRNIAATAGADVGLFASSERLRIYNCTLTGYTATAAATAAVDCGGMGFVLENSTLSGRIALAAHDGLTETVQEPSFISNCRINGAIGIQKSALGNNIVGLLISNCEWKQTLSHVYGLRGMIDIGECSHVKISHNRFSYHPAADGVHARVNASNPGSIWLSKCLITATTNATHAITTGANGARGTGWGLYVEGGAAGASSIYVDQCTVSIFGSSDAGGFKFHQVRGVNVQGCVFLLSGANTGLAGSHFTAIDVDNGSTSFHGQTTIANNSFGQWNDGRSGALRLRACAGATVTGNIFDGRDGGFANIASRNVTYGCALTLEGVDNVSITGNQFLSWDENATASRCIKDTLAGTRVIIVGNQFTDNGNYAVDLATGLTGGTVNDNNIDCLTAGANGQGIRLEGAIYTTANGNAYSGSPGNHAIHWGAAVDCVCVGNKAKPGDIQKSGGGTVRGYFEAADLNLVTSYV